jgi:hypothetical protein
MSSVLHRLAVSGLGLLRGKSSASATLPSSQWVPVAPAGFANCFGCVAPAVSGTPVAPAPIAVSGVVAPFGGPCCGWYGCGNCGWGAGWDWSGAKTTSVMRLKDMIPPWRQELERRKCA